MTETIYIARLSKIKSGRYVLAHSDCPEKCSNATIISRFNIAKNILEAYLQGAITHKTESQIKIKGEIPEDIKQKIGAKSIEIYNVSKKSLVKILSPTGLNPKKYIISNEE